MTGDVRTRINSAVRAVDGILIDADLAQILVHWLGEYARVRQQSHGAAPEGLSEVQLALAEAVAGSRRREDSHGKLTADLGFGHEYVDTTAAAEALGIQADTVRYHSRAGNLVTRRIGRQLLISVDSIEQMKAVRDERTA